MAARNAMRTKTWSFEGTMFPQKFGQSGRGAKARSRRKCRYEPQTKTIWNVESMKDIVHGLLDFYHVHLLFYVIMPCEQAR